MSKKVGNDVGRKKQLRYIKGKYPFTVFDTQTGKLYVRKSITLNKLVRDEKTGEEKFVRQRQVWRLCDPASAANAESLIKEIEADILFLRTGIAKPLSLFSDIAEQFEKIELQEAVYEKGKKIAGRRSLVGPRSTVKMLKSYFGHYPIDEITFGLIETFKSERIKTPVVSKTKSRPRSIRTVHYELGFLRQIFNFAYRRRWLDRSPFDDGKNLINPSDETRRHVTWTKAEEAMALALCQGALLAHMKVVIICITDGGFRRSELLNLKWSEVDFENGVIPAKSYKGKNLHARPVFMTDRMRTALLEWKPVQKKIDKVTDKSLVIGYKDIKHAWETISSKIGRSDIRIHDLRHIFASKLAFDSQLPISVISKALGHSSVKTTEIYINAKTEDLQKVAAAINVLNKAEQPDKTKVKE
jgi:integrase